MSVKVYDKLTGKWVVQATNIAENTYLVDGNGNYQSDNLEDALKEIADELDSLNDRVEYIYENGTIGGNNGGGGGGGSSSLPTLTLSSEKEVSARTDETVDIYVLFQTPNAGNGVLSYSIQSTYSDGNTDGSKPEYETFTREVTAGRLKIAIPGRETGVHKVNIFVTDAMGLVSNAVDVTINSGALELRKLTVAGSEQFFDDSVDALATDALKLGFRISALSATEAITIFISKDGGEFTPHTVAGTVGINTIDYGIVQNVFQFVGNHRIQIYVVQGTVRSNTLLWNVTMVDSENLVISSPVNSEFTQQVGKTTSIEFRNSMQGFSRFLTEVTVTGGGLNKVETLNTDIGVNTWNLGTILDTPGTTYVLTIQSFTTSITGGKGEYESNKLTFRVTVTASEDYTPFTSVTDGAICMFEAEKDNTNAERHIWRDKRGGNNTIVGRLNGFNYSNASGWNPVNSSLAFSGKSYVEFFTDDTFSTPYAPFGGGVGKDGLTVDVRFKVQNIGDIESKVLWCQNNITPFQGINIGIDTTRISSDRSIAIEASFKEDTWINVTYTFFKPQTYNAQNQNMLILYINGVISKVVFLADRADNLKWNGQLFLGAMLDEYGNLNHHGTCEVQALRIYGRALTDDEVLQNFIADHKDEEEQMAIRDRNFGESQIPIMRIECPNYSAMTDETAVEAIVTYNDPADPSKNFQKDGCRINWQGTSSRSYPVKNYTLRLRSGGNDWLTYKPKDSWMPEARYTLKANKEIR